MIEEIATVIAVEAEGVWVKTQAKTTCGACQQKDSCTSGVVAKALTPKEPRLFVVTQEPLLAGQQVRIGLDETALTKSALRVYLLPLLVFIISMALALNAGFPEPLQLLIAIISSAISLALVKAVESRRAKSLTVSLLAVLPSISVSSSVV